MLFFDVVANDADRRSSRGRREVARVCRVLSDRWHSAEASWLAGSKVSAGATPERPGVGVQQLLRPAQDRSGEAGGHGYPRTEVQLCIVHLVRASLNYVPWKWRKAVASDLRLIYRSATAAEAEQHLAEVEAKWKAYPSVSQIWRRNWPRITPFFNYPSDIRRAIYTTNSVESLNRSLRKIIKVRGGFPNEEAALKLLFLALRLAAKKWTMPISHWRETLNHFTILWPERMPALERFAS